MDSNSDITITQKQEVKFCNVCGLPLLVDGMCRKYKKHIKKAPKRGRFSGASKSENAFGKY